MGQLRVDLPKMRERQLSVREHVHLHSAAAADIHLRRRAMTTPSWIPPLPIPWDDYERTGNMMRDYAEQYRLAWVASLKPAAWKDTMYSTDEVGHKSSEPVILGYDGWESIPDATDLYRLDDQP